MNNERTGISAEIAIADVFGVAVNDGYRKRGDAKASDAVKRIVPGLFAKYGIPAPLVHVAEGQNPVDFELEGGKTMSVKTNMGKPGKASPQKIGQPSSNTYFGHFKDIIDCEIPSDYPPKRDLFKQISVSKIDAVMKLYWEGLFHCDYLVWFYGFRTGNVRGVVFEKLSPPVFLKDRFSFTRTGKKWKESTTVKYNGTSIGEFQAHVNRDCLKFRFDIGGLVNAFKL